MATTTSCPRRAGISLLEVLISIFILAVGIVSVLSLFTAGREIRARTALISRAVSFADQMAPTVEAWRDLSEWQARDVSGDFEWVDMFVPGVRLPVIIDPYGLNGNAQNDNQIGWDYWLNFANISYLEPAEPPTSPAPVTANWRQYFRRITFPSVPRTATVDPNAPPGENTLAFEEAISLFSDADAVEYRLPASPSLPPENVFEFGRRKRGGDLSPALMIARQDWRSVPPETGVPMRYWLLVSHKQPRGYDTRGPSPIGPQGSVKFDVVELTDSLIRLSLPPARKPDDGASVRRGLQPGRWLLLVRWHAPAAGWVVHWTKMTSVTRENVGGEDAPDTWLVVPEQAPKPALTWGYLRPPGPPWPAFEPRAFTFDSLMHVQELTGLAGEELM